MAVHVCISFPAYFAASVLFKRPSQGRVGYQEIERERKGAIMVQKEIITVHELPYIELVKSACLASDIIAG